MFKHNSPEGWCSCQIDHILLKHYFWLACHLWSGNLVQSCRSKKLIHGKEGSPIQKYFLKNSTYLLLPIWVKDFTICSKYCVCLSANMEWKLQIKMQRKVVNICGLLINIHWIFLSIATKDLTFAKYFTRIHIITFYLQQFNYEYFGPFWYQQVAMHCNSSINNISQLSYAFQKYKSKPTQYAGILPNQKDFKVEVIVLQLILTVMSTVNAKGLWK